MLMRFFYRIASLRRFETEDGGKLLIHGRVHLRVGANARVIIRGGISTVGYSLPGLVARPSLDKTVIEVKEGGTLFIGPNVYIAPGTFIHVGSNAALTLHGGNWIANNCTLICKQQMDIHQNVSMAWNVNLIDDDGRDFFDTNGNVIKSTPRMLQIMKNAALQMNVVIPRGIKIGENSVVGANTVLRQDVPDNCLVYQNPELRIKTNKTFGWQYDKKYNAQKG